MVSRVFVTCRSTSPYEGWSTLALPGDGVSGALLIVNHARSSGVLSFRSTFGRSTGHNSISSIGSTNISEGSIRSTNFIVEKFNKIYQD